MKYFLGSIPIASVVSIAGWAVLANHFVVDSSVPSAAALTKTSFEAANEWPEDLLTVDFRTKLTPVSTKVPVARIKTPPEQPKTPAPKPALRLNGTLIGIVTAPSHQHIVFQTRTGVTHVVKVGEQLPAEDKRLSVQKIDIGGAVFTDGERTLRQDLESGPS